MVKRRVWILLLLAVILRLLVQGWDVGSSSTTLHPDERQVSFITEKVHGWFTDPEFYAYGSLHFQVIHAVASVTGLDDSLRELVVSGRVVSLAASVLSILLGWLVALRAWGRRTATLFVALAAWVPLDLQQSHFATVEAHHAMWVMATLAACYWLATGGRIFAAAGAGAAFGASLAVKVASLPIALPLAAAILLGSGLSVCRSLRFGAAAAAAATTGFWLCQPSAFVSPWSPLVLAAALAVVASALAVGERPNSKTRWAAFAVAGAAGVVVCYQALSLIGAWQVGPGLASSYLEDVAEQVAMVVGASDPPYVRVYAHSLPVLYPLRELAAWGLGPGLLVAAIIGSIAGLRVLLRRWRRLLEGRWNRSAVVLMLLLLWVIPMAARLATLHVKYLRYWEPLVVPAALIAAWWLSRQRVRVGRVLGLVVVSGTVLWGIAYLWAFIEPHPHRTAARWLTPMLEEGQAIAFESWDESLPLGSAEGLVERVTLPSYDLPDDEAKARRWAAELVRADWVVMTSNRVMRTILKNPQRFPLTGRLYRLLLTGEAGFEPLTRVSRGPRILGLRWPVQRADESFVNYDFPQVIILRKTADVRVDDLVERVRRPLPFLEGLDDVDLQQRYVAPLPAVPAVPTAARQLLDLAIWAVAFAALSLAAWTLLLPLLRSLPDAGLGLATTSGWVFLAWVMWLGNELGLWPAGPQTASWLFLFAVGCGFVVTITRWRKIRGTVAARGGTMVRVAVVTFGIGLLFLLVRAGNPAIFWGEKPMDFAFLNAFLDASVWPPGEPWMAGMPLHYYYFGQVLASVPILVVGCSSGVGYNLMAATIPALATAVLATLGLLVARRRRWSAVTMLPLLVLLSGNLAWPWLLHFARESKWFDLWWGTSRVIPGFAIDEYPLWTAIFADLHGHFIALPVLLTALTWGWVTLREPTTRWVAAAAACGVTAAVLVATNPWDLFIFTGALGLGCLFAARHPLVGLGRLVMAALISLLAAAPFIAELMGGLEAGAGGPGLFLSDGDFAPAWAILRHFGLFLIPTAAAAFMKLGRRSWLVLPTGGLGVVAGLALGSPAAALALAFAALFGTVALSSRARLQRLAWSMALLGVLAIAACERFTLIDRMNTLFKIYNGVWLVLAIALATLLLRGHGWQRRVLLATWLPLQAAALVNLPLGIAQGLIQPRIRSPIPTIDGRAFLATEDPQTWFLVRALQGMARPGEVVAESAGPYYSQHTRIVMHTGQPTVVGWEWHLTQRGQSLAEITARMADLETLYASRPPQARRQVLDRYRVRWVVLADLERQRYEMAGGDLRGIPGLVEIARHGGAALYRVEPLADGFAPPLRPQFELPTGSTVLAALPPAARESRVRSLALGRDAGFVVLKDGRTLQYDLSGKLRTEIPSPGCEVASLALVGATPWVVCEGGEVFRRDGNRWAADGRVAPGSRLAGGTSLWSWGPRGLHRRAEGGWQRRVNRPVTAAAGRDDWVAWSDGRMIRVLGPTSQRIVGGSFTGVRDLAWMGLDLLALTDSGLVRSGGSVLPWRPVVPAIDAPDAVAGRDAIAWMVVGDGLLVELAAPDCPDPWNPTPSRPAASLREPRDVAASVDGWFAVADSLNHRVVWFGLGGTCLDRFGSEGAQTAEFREPSGLAVADDGTVAVTDTWNGRVQILRPDGSVEVVGSALYGPRDALWTAGGSLLVADTGNRRLLRFDPPDWHESVVAELEGPVVGLAELTGRVAVAVPQAGYVALVDPASGGIVGRLPVPGWESREQQEGYLAVLPSGELVASAPETGELWALDPSGTKPPRVLGDGLPGVTGLALLPDGSLIASLTWEQRLVRVPVE